jgi:dihydropteroate synthase
MMKTDADPGAGVMRCGRWEFRWGERTYVMGIVNLDPRSFSGDGLGGTEAAVEQAHRMVDEGADMIDVGGESTRPDAKETEANEELGRVLPVIERLSAGLPVPVSIDTYKSDVAREALAAGAVIINDVWGLRRDNALASVAAESGVPVIISQNQRGSTFRDFFPELVASLRDSMHLALDAGVDRDSIIIDPGVGFGKTVGQNLEIVRRLSELRELGRPILLGTSRKSFIGLTLDLPVEERLEGTAATVAIGIANGADIVRVHDVKEMVRVARMSDAVIRGAPSRLGAT